MLVTVYPHHIYSCSISLCIYILVFKHGCEVDGAIPGYNVSAKLGEQVYVSFPALLPQWKESYNLQYQVLNMSFECEVEWFTWIFKLFTKPKFNYKAEVMLCKPMRVYWLYYYLKYLSSIKYGQCEPLYARYMFGTYPLCTLLNDVSQREHVSFDNDLTKDFTWYKTVWYPSKLLP